MDQMLVKAARDGDVNRLLNLLEGDPEILERASSGHFVDSALHVAALYGKAEFVKQIVIRMPSLATDPNQQGMIPLHLASLKGHVQTVRELLKAKLDDDDGVNQCLAKDDEGWTALHCASRKGKMRVMEELMSACPECLEQVTAKGETVLHLAVKANQFEAVKKVLAERIKMLPNFQELVKARDINGKTVYDLAAAKKELQVLEILKEDEEEGDEIREESRINMKGEGEGSGSKASEEEQSNPSQLQEDAILVVATLIITLTYQAMANPPSLVFKDGTAIEWGCLRLGLIFGRTSPDNLKDCPALLAFWFLLLNTIIFVTSIIIVVSTFRGRETIHLQLLTLHHAGFVAQSSTGDDHSEHSMAVGGPPRDGRRSGEEPLFFTPAKRENQGERKKRKRMR
ncbi:ankyrin repeat-containing protein BDA1-like [Neltuma alba]|uniref:ankyrin repeat-containing protein BDA1-like n=1 Tax=Neltuma alba TaxID=207710 RepID=UPI0010A4BDB5|nr:ankyrin repeat-containing protein BDA1-like [Prosopis alba]